MPGGTGGSTGIKISALYLWVSRFVLPLTFYCLAAVSCSERIFVEENSPSLTFSDDTIHFDTVFTSIGTITKEFRVYNQYNRWLKIDRIFLGGGTSSPFRLNIDGEPTIDVSGVELAPGDSIFIFVDVIIDPLGEDNPVAILDSVVFIAGNSLQSVNLLAWGQDIHLVSGEITGTTTWGNDKPWVIYNSVTVDTGEILTVEAGARVLFHRGSTMYVAGTLLVRGEYENSVLFSSDRTEEEYNEIPGQWEGINFINSSYGNTIDNAVIKNAVSGIHLGNIDSFDEPPDLVISNSVIRNMTVSGISSLGANISANNCEISHCGFFNLFLAMGGSYSFAHCTVAGTWEYSARTTPSVLISDYYDYNTIRYKGELLSAHFINSVIYGTGEGEIAILPQLDSEVLNCSFGYSLITIDEGNSYWDNYDLSTDLVNGDPQFIGFSDLDFRPDTLSVLTGTADRSVSLIYPSDLRGFNRFMDEGPDIGAYERQPGEKRASSK